MTTRRRFLLTLASLALAPRLARMGMEAPAPEKHAGGPASYVGEWVWTRAEPGTDGFVRMVHSDGRWEDVPAETGYFAFQFRHPNPEWTSEEPKG